MDNVTSEDIMNIVIRAGCMVLENGGETYRTEETIVHIAKSLGAKTASAFVTPTVVMFSYTDENDHYHSGMKRINKKVVNLQAVSRVNDLSRRLEKRSRLSSPSQVANLLDRIEKAPVYPSWLIVCGAALSSACFAFLFGGMWKEAVAAFVIGTMLRFSLILLSKLSLSDFITSLFSGAFASILAALVFKMHLIPSSFTTMLAVLMQVVPGLAIVTGIRDLMSGHLVSGTVCILVAFMSAEGLSVGSALGIFIFSEIFFCLLS